jgi:hypothetical protein
LKKTTTKRAGGVAQDVGSELKPQCHKKKEKGLYKNLAIYYS